MSTELVANSPTPGSAAAITTLSVAVNTTPAPGTVETWTFTSAPPAALQAAGQYHFTIDSEICIDVTGGAGASRQIQRGAEGSTVATHLSGASIFHGLTAGGLLNYVATNLPATVAAPSSGQGFGTDIYAALANGGPKGDATTFDAPAINALLATGKDVHLAGTGSTYLVDAPIQFTSAKQKLHLHGSTIKRAPQWSAALTADAAIGATSIQFNTANARVGQQITIVQGATIEIPASNIPHTITAINGNTVQLDGGRSPGLVNAFTVAGSATVYLVGFLVNVGGYDPVTGNTIYAPNCEMLGGEIDGNCPSTALSAALSTGAPITTLPVTPLTTVWANGSTVTTALGSYANQNFTSTQTWTLTQKGNIGDTVLHVSSQTPNFAYPAYGTAVNGPNSFTVKRFELTVELNVDILADGFQFAEGLYVHDYCSEGIVAVDCWDPTWQGVRIYNGQGNGIHMGSSIGQGVFAPRIRGCHIENTNLNPTLPHADGNIVLSRFVSDLSVDDCHLANGLCGVGSINTIDNSDVTIRGGEIRNQQRNAIDGLSISGSPSFSANRVLIEGVRIYSCAAMTISALGGWGAASFPTDWTLSNLQIYSTPLILSVVQNVKMRGLLLDWTGDTTHTLLTLDGVRNVDVEATCIGGAYAVSHIREGHMFLSGGKPAAGTGSRADGYYLFDYGIDLDLKCDGQYSGAVLAPYNNIPGLRIKVNAMAQSSCSTAYVGVLAGGGADVQAAMQLSRVGAAGVKLTGPNPTAKRCKIDTGVAKNPLVTYEGVVASDSPSSFWRFNEASGTTAFDSAGSAPGTYNTVTLGTTGLIAGNPATAVTFPGTVSDNATFGVNYAFAGTAAFSLEAWIKVTTMTASMRIFSTEQTGAGTKGYDLIVSNTGGNLRFDRTDSGGAADNYAVAAAMQTGKIYHVVATYDGAAMRIYVNGAIVGTSGASTRALPAAAVNFTIGTTPNGANPFNGVIAMPAVYPVALSAAQILNHYNTGAAVPSSILIDASARGAIVRDCETDLAVVDNGTSSALGTTPTNATVTWLQQITNPSFETNTTGWITSGIGGLLAAGATPTRVTTQAYSGLASCQVVTDGLAAAEGIATQIGAGTMYAGQDYFFSVYMKGNAGGELVDLLIGGQTSQCTLTTGWQRFMVYVTSDVIVANLTGNSAYAVIRGHASGAITFFVDAAQVTRTAFPIVYSDT